MLTFNQIKQKIIDLTENTPDNVSDIVSPVDKSHLIDILTKNEKVFWPYLLFAYQIEFETANFNPKNINENERELAFSPTSPLPPNAVQVMRTPVQITSNFSGKRSENPIFKQFFDDIKAGKSRNFVNARLKAATGKDPSFLDFPDDVE